MGAKPVGEAESGQLIRHLERVRDAWEAGCLA